MSIDFDGQNEGKALRCQLPPVQTIELKCMFYLLLIMVKVGVGERLECGFLFLKDAFQNAHDPTKKP